MWRKSFAVAAGRPLLHRFLERLRRPDHFCFGHGGLLLDGSYFLEFFLFVFRKSVALIDAAVALN
jgi:hypothetical protein